MTTDITELAQSLKAAAEKASGGDWVTESGDGWDATCSNDDQANSGFIIAHFVGPDSAANREFVQLANPANVLALVEALEKAQRANGHLREQSAEWERKAISNFEDCAEMSARIEELEVQRELAFAASNRWADKFTEAERRIAELESRTVTVKLPDDEDGQAYGFGKWANRAIPATAGTMMISYCEDSWRAAFEVFSNGAGIKWEAE